MFGRTRNIAGDDETEAILQENGKTRLLSANWAVVMLCGEMIGAGSLSLSVAVQTIGFYTGLTLYLTLTLVSAFYAYALSHSYAKMRPHLKEAVNQQHLRDPYPQLTRFIIGSPSMYLVVVAIIMSDFLGTAGLLLLPADTLVRSFLFTFSDDYGELTNIRLWVVVFTVIVTPLTWNDRPKDNKFIGVITLSSAVIANALILVLYSICATEQKTSVDVNNDPGTHTFKNYIMAIGVLLTTTDGFDILPTIQEDMQDRSEYGKVIWRTYACFTTITVPVMVGGFLLYTRHHHLSENILIEISVAGDKLDRNTATFVAYKILSLITLVMFIVHILTSAVLQMNPTFQYIESRINFKDGFDWKRCVVRTVVMLLITSFVLASPSLLTILSFNGTIIFVFLGTTIPGIVYFKIFRMSTVSKASLATVCIVFLLYLVFNSYFSISTIFGATN